jgi:hypothetical protein
MRRIDSEILHDFSFFSKSHVILILSMILSFFILLNNIQYFKNHHINKKCHVKSHVKSHVKC